MPTLIKSGTMLSASSGAIKGLFSREVGKYFLRRSHVYNETTRRLICFPHIHKISFYFVSDASALNLYNKMVRGLVYLTLVIESEGQT